MALAGGLASPVSRRGLVGEYGMGVHLLTTDGAGITISTLIGQEVYALQPSGFMMPNRKE